MVYMGSKAKYAKNIIPFIISQRKKNQHYVEPFCGGANVIDKITGNRIANDINPYLIALFKAIQSGYIPPTSISENDYIYVRENKEKFSPELVGFYGVAASYSAIFFGGYARGWDNKGNPRNYVLERQKNILAQKEGIMGIDFYNIDYRELPIPTNSIIYCDPPYKGTAKYKYMENFDYNVFYDWCEYKVEEGNTVYVSEYSAPNTWELLWQKEVCSSLTQDKGAKKSKERLYKVVI